MNLKIGEKTLEIKSCTRMRDTVRGFYLDLVITKDVIGMDELYNLLDGCTENIVITEDNGTVNTYIGFKTIGSFVCENGEYKISQVCTSEYEAQLSLAQSKIEEQDKIIATQAEEIEMLNNTLLETIMMM